MAKKLDIIEIEYSELASIPKIFKNFKLGMKIRTNPVDMEQDKMLLVATVRSGLQEIIAESKRENEEKRRKRGKNV